MKVAVSIPDALFQAAERTSKGMRLTRSRFYAKAIEAYLKANSGEDLTKRLNAVHAKTSSKIDPALEIASLEVLRREKW